MFVVDPYLLRSETSQLTLGQVARVFAIFQNFFTEYLGPHTLHCLLSEKLKGIGNSKWGHSGTLGKFQIAHSQGFGWWCEIQVLLGIEVVGAHCIRRHCFDDWLDIWVRLVHRQSDFHASHASKIFRGFRICGLMVLRK